MKNLRVYSIDRDAGITMKLKICITKKRDRSLKTGIMVENVFDGYLPPYDDCVCDECCTMTIAQCQSLAQRTAM